MIRWRAAGLLTRLPQLEVLSLMVRESRTVGDARRCVLALGLVVGCSLFACTGSIEAPSDGQGSGAGIGGAGPGVGATGAVGSDPTDPRIAQRIWRLSPTELNQEITRLFGEGAPAVDVPETAAQFGITNIAQNAVIDQGNASIFVDGARAVANWVAADGVKRGRCIKYGDAACMETLLGWLPRAAFRRPVSDAELAELRTLFGKLQASYEYDYAFAGVIRAVLLSPDFLYRTELNAVLSPYEIANLLSFSITDQAPDAELIDAADKQDLTKPDVREAQARRLMAKSAKVWQRFFWEWLHMSTLRSQGAEVGLSDTLVSDMDEEYRTFLREVIVNQRGTLRDVLSAPYTWAQPELAMHYGSSPSGTGLQRIALDPVQRGGLFTQGAWLVSHGKAGHDNVVRRGMGIYKDAMCNNNLRPPDGVDVQAELAKLVGPNPTVRQTVDARGNTSPCAGCHKRPDPMGMVFETFKSDGSWQKVYPDGMPVDSKVTVDTLGSFDNARSLSQAFADDASFQQCFVQRFTHFIAGIDLGLTRTVAWSKAADQSLVDSNGKLEEMVVALVRHPGFIERRTESAP
ncbi:MAG: hypothetical protein JWN04_5962 [Myxococcaceae bacterium]|nr:hypothetical protein [Myxococcaceae bacterium]